MQDFFQTYGQRPLPSFIDEIACKDPERPYVSIARSSDARHGFRSLDFLTLANCINRCSWWIEEQIGKGRDFDTISYMGPPDLLYAILIVSANKTGHKVSIDRFDANIISHAIYRCSSVLLATAWRPIYHF